MGDEEKVIQERAPLSEWLTCFCVVKFDIEIGQSMLSLFIYSFIGLYFLTLDLTFI